MTVRARAAVGAGSALAAAADPSRTESHVIRRNINAYMAVAGALPAFADIAAIGILAALARQGRTLGGGRKGAGVAARPLTRDAARRSAGHGIARITLLHSLPHIPVAAAGVPANVQACVVVAVVPVVTLLARVNHSVPAARGYNDRLCPGIVRIRRSAVLSNIHVQAVHGLAGRVQLGPGVPLADLEVKRAGKEKHSSKRDEDVCIKLAIHLKPLLSSGVKYYGQGRLHPPAMHPKNAGSS